MKLFRLFILSLIFWNLPSVILSAWGSTMGSIFSYLSIGLLIGYYFFEKKTAPNWWILMVTIFYFLISSFQYSGDPKFFINDFIKCLVLIIGGYELIKRVTINELFYILLLGSMSILMEALFFPISKGRYSGFYLNPNVAGFICIFGFALTYGVSRWPLKMLGQFVFTLMGLLTFSRTFILIWILLNLVSLKISIKNIRILGIGVMIFSSLLMIDKIVGLKNPRFEQLKNIVNNNNKVSNQEITEDSRTETWSLYYDKILDAPTFGNGYRTFAGEMLDGVGVHNTYLLILGEAGIIPFFFFVAFFLYLIYWGICFFKPLPYLIMQTICLIIFLLANHNFFNFYYLILAAMWIQFQIIEYKAAEHKVITSKKNVINI